jgi:hypothetical protein
MQTRQEPQFELTEAALRWLTAHPGPLEAEHTAPEPRDFRNYGPIRAIEGGKR